MSTEKDPKAAEKAAIAKSNGEYMNAKAPVVEPLFPRAGGVLLHPTSLPSPHGVGDMGRGARAFVDWLHAAKLTRWQVLPLVPAGPGGSPYSSPSAFAGNPLLI